MTTTFVIIWVIVNVIVLGGAVWLANRRVKKKEELLDIDRQTYEENKKSWVK